MLVTKIIKNYKFHIILREKLIKNTINSFLEFFLLLSRVRFGDLYDFIMSYSIIFDKQSVYCLRNMLNYVYGKHVREVNYNY